MLYSLWSYGTDFIITSTDLCVEKLDAAMMEHRRYVSRILEYMRMCGNPDVLAELYIACQFHNN